MKLKVNTIGFIGGLDIAKVELLAQELAENYKILLAYELLPKIWRNLESFSYEVYRSI